MERVTTLNNLHEGQWANVIALQMDGDMRRRLQDLGLIEGTKVLCVQKSPAGDPIAYLIRGAVIALRVEDSENILVCGCSKGRGLFME